MSKEEYGITHIARCNCGAYTVTIGGESYSVSKENFFKFFPNLKPRATQKFCNCNHCVNHWGLDLCACGSGEAFDKCDGGFSWCGTPMQKIDVRTHVNGGW